MYGDQLVHRVLLVPEETAGMAIVLRPRSSPRAAGPSPPRNGVVRAIEYATKHPREALTAADLARIAFMSPRNFSRRFREVTGTSPSRWLAVQRVARARELLETTDLPIQRIAVEAGFGSAVTFRSRFAQAERMSPAAYRKAFRARNGPAGVLLAVP
jgi:AraC family transcriptional activator FtrA